MTSINPKQGYPNLVWFGQSLFSIANCKGDASFCNHVGGTLYMFVDSSALNTENKMKLIHNHKYGIVQSPISIAS